MGMDVTTRTVQDVFNRVKRQFGDESGTQLTDSDIMMWINSGQLEIIKSNKVLKASGTTTSVLNQETYTFPSDNILTIESLYYDGYPLTYTSFEEFKEQILKNGDNSATASGTPTMFWEWGNELHLYPLPDTAGKTMKLYYIKHPADVDSAGDTLSIPDVYFDTLVDYVLSRAYEMDDDFQAAGVKRRDWADGLEKGAEREVGQVRGTYPMITILEDDL